MRHTRRRRLLYALPTPAAGIDAEALCREGVPDVRTPAQASTGGLVRELAEGGLASGARVLCPVPAVLAPLTEPFVVPRFLEGLQQVRPGFASPPLSVFSPALRLLPAGQLSHATERLHACTLSRPSC